MLQRMYSLPAAVALLAASSAWADDMYLKVRAIGNHIECTCGCSSTISTCNMVGCHIRVPINEEIEAGIEAGRSQEDILAAVYEKYGEEMRVEPRREGFGIVGWAMPFVSLLPAWRSFRLSSAAGAATRGRRQRRNPYPRGSSTATAKRSSGNSRRWNKFFPGAGISRSARGRRICSSPPPWF